MKLFYLKEPGLSILTEYLVMGNLCQMAQRVNVLDRKLKGEVNISGVENRLLNSHT